MHPDSNQIRARRATFRQLHAAVLATGALPPESQWQPVMDAAVAAMLRLEK